MVESQEHKQAYLREHIVERGYDTTQFATFLMHKTGGSNDINLFSFEQLQHYVAEFIAGVDSAGQDQYQDQFESNQDQNQDASWNMPAEGGQDQQNYDQQDYSNHDQDYSHQPQPQHQLISQRVGQEDEVDDGLNEDHHQPEPQLIKEEKKAPSARNNASPAAAMGASQSNKGLTIAFESRVKTNPVMPTRLSEIEAAQIEVQVTDGLIQSKRVILKTHSFLTYKVHVPHLKTEVRRQDEEFDQLQQYLIKAYPNVIVPAIKLCKPQKHNASKYINKRGVAVSRFLRNVLRNRLLRGDQFLMLFLTEDNAKQYKSGKVAMDKFQKVEKISELVTYEGLIDLNKAQVTEVGAQLAPKVQLASFQTEKAYIYLHEQIRRLACDLEAAGKTVKNIEDCFQTLHRTSFNIQQGTEESKQLEEQVRYFYKCSQEVFSKYATTLQGLSDHFLQGQSKFFQQLALEGERIGKMQKQVADIQAQYQQRNQHLQEKQQKMFNDKSVSKWQNPDVARMAPDDQKELLRDVKNMSLIFPAEQHELWSIRQMYTHLVQSLHKEMSLNEQWVVFDMKATFNELCQVMKVNVEDQRAVWQDFDQQINYKW